MQQTNHMHHSLGPAYLQFTLTRAYLALAFMAALCMHSPMTSNGVTEMEFRSTLAARCGLDSVRRDVHAAERAALYYMRLAERAATSRLCGMAAAERAMDYYAGSLDTLETQRARLARTIAQAFEKE